MAERFFRIKKGSETHKKLVNCREQNNKFRELMKKFLPEHGIETDAYYVSFDRLMIEPTEADVIKFKKFMMANGKEFKKSSIQNKEYIAAIKESGIDTRAVSGLSLWEYGVHLNSGGSYRNFKDESTDTFYLSIDAKNPNESYNITEDAEEIKGSEFYMILEKVKESK